MGNALVDDSARREVASAVLVRGIGREEPHVMPFSTHDEGDGRLVLLAADFGRGLSESLELLADGSVRIAGSKALTAYSTTCLY